MFAFSRRRRAQWGARKPHQTGAESTHPAHTHEGGLEDGEELGVDGTCPRCKAKKPGKRLENRGRK